MQLSMNVKYDIRWPKELVQKRTQRMVDTTGNEIVRGIRRNIMESLSIYGGKLRKLKSDTVRRKKGMRYPNRALYALGILYRSIHYFKGHRPNIGTVGIMRRGRPSRREVAIYQQTGLYQGGTARRFFGISRELRSRLNSMWGSWFNNIMSRRDILKSGKI